MHTDDGSVIKAGSTVVIPELAEALELIARDGAETMYTGELAELLIRDMAENDGILTAEEHATGSEAMFGKMDANKDGFLSKKELTEGHASMMKK